MAFGKVPRVVRALIASVMLVLLVATPVTASIAPVLTGTVSSAPGEGPGSETFSEWAHYLALLQLGFGQSQDACAAGEARAQADTNGTVWFLGGCLFTGLALAGAYMLEPTPPATALVGQSDDYVAHYTDCYRETAKSARQ